MKRRVVRYLDLEFTEVAMHDHAPPAHDTQTDPSGCIIWF